MAAPPPTPPALRGFLERAPKAEVHVHLEGAVSPEFLDDAAARGGLAWAGHAREELRRRSGFGSFAGFLDAFRWVLEWHFRTPEDYARGARDVARGFAAQRIRYAEVSISAGALVFFGRPFGEIAHALTEAAAEIERGGGPELRFVADGVQAHGPGPLGQVLDVLSGVPRERWPALGLAGAQRSVPARDFEDVFRDARGVGLAADIHAGEAEGPAGVWDALEWLGADRLVHGVAAASDPALVRHLRARRTPLALNLTSNVRTGAVAGPAVHPLRRFLAAGLVLSVNTDDPTLFDTSLAAELELAASAFGLGQSALEGLLLGGLECAFLPERRRARLLEAWAGELDALRREAGLEERLAGSPPRVYGGDGSERSEGSECTPS